MATLLTVVQEFCGLKAIPVPLTVMGSSEAQVIQIRSLITEGCEALVERGPWEKLTNEATFTTLATESQGAVDTIASNGFDRFIPGTFFDRTNQVPLDGPMTPQAWQEAKSLVATGPRYSFRIRGGNFLVQPAPTAGYTWAFEYMSRYFIQDTVGAAYRETFNLDSNEILFPKAVVRADLLWRWLKAKGLSYAEEFNSAEILITSALGRDGGQRILHMDSEPAAFRGPGICIPSGTWPL